jgi:hypothetical protein
VRHKSICFIWPRFVKIHSWLPPVSWHWYNPILTKTFHTINAVIHS